MVDFSQAAAQASLRVDNSDDIIHLELLPPEQYVDDASPPRNAPWYLPAKMVPADTLVSVEITPPPPHYERGQRIGVLLEGFAAFQDATIDTWAADPLRPTRYHIQLDDASTQTLDLNHANHCRQRFASMDEYEEAWHDLSAHIAESTRVVEDAITGMEMDIADQTLNINTSLLGGVKWPGMSSQSLKELVPAMLPTQRGRALGTLEARRVLVSAEAGTGKTWSAYQLVNEVANRAAKRDTSHGVHPVPMLCFVQRIARMLQGTPDNYDISAKIILQYMVAEYPSRPAWWAVVAQAIEMGTLHLNIDGMDKAAGRRIAVGRFVRHVLVPMGINIVATTRPEGVDAAKFESEFTIVMLEPLDAKQIQLAINRQLRDSEQGHEFSDHLLSVLDIRKSHDRFMLTRRFRLQSFGSELRRSRR